MWGLPWIPNMGSKLGKSQGSDDDEEVCPLRIIPLTIVCYWKFKLFKKSRVQNELFPFCHTYSSFGSLCANLNMVLLVWLLTAKCKKDNIFLFRCLVFFCYFNQFFPEWPSWRHKDKDHRTGRISKFLLHWVSRLQLIWLLSDQEFGSRYEGGMDGVCNLDLYFSLNFLSPHPDLAGIRHLMKMEATSHWRGQCVSSNSRSWSVLVQGRSNAIPLEKSSWLCCWKWVREKRTQVIVSKTNSFPWLKLKGKR